MKKILTAFLCLSLVICLSACSANRTNDRTGTTTPEKSDLPTVVTHSEPLELSSESAEVTTKEKTTPAAEETEQIKDNETSDSGGIIDLPKIGF